MNYLSLFSGIGGIDLGLDRAGWTCVGQVEIDPFCRAVLARHWPEVPKHDDVRTCVDWWRSEPRPAVAAVVGGFPCQPVSVAGHQRAQEDDRWLWPVMARVVRDLRPDWVLLENVPGLLGRGMGDVLGDLATCGYDAQWDCVPAAAVGAVHRRDRVFVVAYPGSEPRRLQPEPEPGGSDTPVARHDRADGCVALAKSNGWQPRWSGDAAQRTRGGQPRGSGLGTHVADTDRAGHPGRGLGRSWTAPVRDSWWDVESDVGRVAHGVPRRVDRLRALGNAVVPQVAEHLGRLVFTLATE